MANYKIYFQRKGDDASRLHLPVNPEKLEIQGSAETQEYNVLSLGQIVVPRNRKLRKFSIESFFPAMRLPDIPLAEWHFPVDYILFFRNAMEQNTVLTFVPLRYHETGLPYAPNLYGFDVVVTAFTYEERAGETGDFWYSLSCTEYRDYAPKLYQVVQTQENGTDGQSVTEAASEPTRETPLSEIVVGSVCIANGRYYASSYGQEPHGNASGRRVKVSRIVDAKRAYPYHITTEKGGWLGWIQRDALQVVENP